MPLSIDVCTPSRCYRPTRRYQRIQSLQYGRCFSRSSHFAVPLTSERSLIVACVSRAEQWRCFAAAGDRFRFWCENAREWARDFNSRRSVTSRLSCERTRRCRRKILRSMVSLLIINRNTEILISSSSFLSSNAIEPSAVPSMSPAASSSRVKNLHWEDILLRCHFIRDRSARCKSGYRRGNTL